MTCPDFDVAPFLLIWEVTQACALACRHCRASAIDRRDPLELSTDEGFALIDEAAGIGTPLLVLTGGDPLQRTDLEDLIRRGKDRALRVGTIPAATARLTAARVRSLADAGLDQMAMSLDAPSAEEHDGFRGEPECFARTFEGAKLARDAGVPFQINTVFAAWNAHHFDAMADLVQDLGAVFWEVFFLVPTGRGTVVDGMAPETYEQLFGELYALQSSTSMVIKVTEAPHYRRYVVEREREAAAGGTAARVRGRLMRTSGPGGSIGQSPMAVNSGRGFCFVSHTGDVMPSGFLPIVAGNLREATLTGLYRDSEIFRGLRDRKRLQGRCGACEFAGLCGGSRSRAYALTGDPYAEDDSCAYVPAGYGDG